jgi:GT2 family glycosyltransferase
MTSGTKSFIVIPVHNRKDVTLRCLGMLTGLESLGWCTVVVDDGSTDGTATAIRENHPAVTLLAGDGSLFWTGAIELGMRHAIAEGAQCCIWLNDDLRMDPAALVHLADFAMSHNAITSAQGIIEREDLGRWYFPALFKGAKSLLDRDIDPTSTEPFVSDTTRGNVVAIPRVIIEEIGYPDGRNIPHVGGDTDYGLRATAAGFECFTLPSIIFNEEENVREDNRSWLLGTRPIGKTLRQSLGKRGSLYPRMVWTYNTRHWGFLTGVISTLWRYTHLFLIVTIRCIIPRNILLKVYATRSHAYKSYEGCPEKSAEGN